MAIAASPADGSVYPRRILICTGEAHIARLIQINLERQGHTIELAKNAAEADDQLLMSNIEVNPRFDIVVIDGRLRDGKSYYVLDSCWFYETIKSDGEPDGKFVVLLDSEDDLPFWKQNKYQPHKYLVKPFNPSEILH